MRFNKRKMEDQRLHLAEKEANARHTTEKLILEDADHLLEGIRYLTLSAQKRGKGVGARLPQAAVRYIVPSHERYRILLSRRRSLFRLPSRGRAYRDSR